MSGGGHVKVLLLRVATGADSGCVHWMWCSPPHLLLRVGVSLRLLLQAPERWAGLGGDRRRGGREGKQGGERRGGEEGEGRWQGEVIGEEERAG